MGLDFTIYKKKVNETCEQAWHATTSEWRESGYTTNSERELAYGRKSWELVYELVPDYGDYFDSDDPIVSKERWDSLMNKLSKISDSFDEVREAFRIVDNAPDDFPEMVITDDVKNAIAKYELWYNMNFDQGPQLGYDFSVGYMEAFWNANEKVQEAFNDPEWEVRASVSY